MRYLFNALPNMILNEIHKALGSKYKLRIQFFDNIKYERSNIRVRFLTTSTEII